MNGRWTVAGGVMCAACVAGMAWGAEFFVKQDGTGPGGYTNVQSALTAAKSAADGAHTITILDSGNYDESVNVTSGTTTNDFFTFRPAGGQTPTLYGFYLYNQGAGVAFSNLIFDSRMHWPGRGFTNDSAIYLRPASGNQVPNADEIVRVENCIFRGGSNWTSAYGVMVRYDQAGSGGRQVTVVGNRFEIDEAPAKGAGVYIYSGNLPNVVIVSNYFRALYGVQEGSAVNASFRRTVQYNVFDRVTGAGYYWRVGADPTNSFIEHNTFYKASGTDQFNHGAIFVRRHDSVTLGNIGLRAVDNLFYGSGTNTATWEGLYFYQTGPTNSSISYNGFCNMRQVGGIDYPARWTGTWQTVTAVNAIPGCSNNIVNNTDPFVDAANGNFHLKPGSWALAAGSGGGYIGAFDTAFKPATGTVVLLR